MQENMVRRIVNFNTHLQREEHFDDDVHQRNLDNLEKGFHANNSSPFDSLKLGVRLHDMGKSSDAVFLWENATKRAKKNEDAIAE